MTSSPGGPLPRTIKEALVRAEQSYHQSSATFFIESHLPPCEAAESSTSLVDMEKYRPDRLSDLIDNTPDDIIQRALLDLDPRIGALEVGGHRVRPLPIEFSWFVGSAVKSETLYTFVQEVVRRELKQFADRIERYYYLVPKGTEDVPHEQATAVEPSTE